MTTSLLAIALLGLAVEPQLGYRRDGRQGTPLAPAGVAKRRTRRALAAASRRKNLRTK